MDEQNGTSSAGLSHSIAPCRNSRSRENTDRPAGVSGNALDLNGASNWLNLDPDNSGYLENPSMEELLVHGLK